MRVLLLNVGRVIVLAEYPQLNPTIPQYLHSRGLSTPLVEDPWPVRAVKRRVSAAKGKRGIKGGERVLGLPQGGSWLPSLMARETEEGLVLFNVGRASCPLVIAFFNPAFSFPESQEKSW